VTGDWVPPSSLRNMHGSVAPKHVIAPNSLAAKVRG
jgi:hypothetical protein